MTLRFFQENDEPKIASYEITDEQLKYTIAPLHSLKESIGNDQRHPIVFTNEEGQLVTYFVLHEKDGVAPYSSNKEAVLLRSFSTANNHLKKGYAKAALEQLPDFVRLYFPHINEIVLAVNVGNEIAKFLYEKCGFIDYGERREGSKGELIIMSYSL